ncbi:MAG TPA: NUDIX domain-containing protein, partial [Bacteroides sp.]|nr:NUDIX domain-containing protein [Bacteroides sp.]
MHVWNIPGVNRNVTGSMTDVTCAVVVERGMVLVTQRSEQMDHPLKWEFPGGKVKEGETPESCIMREIREELGLTVMVKLRLPVVVHRYGHREVRLIPFV